MDQNQIDARINFYLEDIRKELKETKERLEALEKPSQ